MTVMSGILHGRVITAPAVTIITMVTTAAAVPPGMAPAIVRIMAVTAAMVAVAAAAMDMVMGAEAIIPPEATTTSLRS